MTLPFNPNVPLATSSPSQDQPILLSNSQTWNTTWNADGVTAGSSTNVGYSNWRTFVRRLAGNTPAPDSVNGRLFSMEDTAGVAQLFWLAAIQDGGGYTQLTSNSPDGSNAGSSGYYSYVIAASPYAVTIQQWFWILPGNLQVKIIQSNVPPSANSSVAYYALPYVGNGGVAANFASQPLIGMVSSGSGVLANIKGLFASSGTLPSASSTTLGAYVDGAVLSISGGTSSQSTLIIGV